MSALLFTKQSKGSKGLPISNYAGWCRLEGFDNQQVLNWSLRSNFAGFAVGKAEVT
jgi:hypothetical protein